MLLGDAPAGMPWLVSLDHTSTKGRDADARLRCEAEATPEECANYFRNSGYAQT
jgi:hypothetical protein